MVGDYGVAAAQTCQPERHAALDREISIRQRRRNNSGSKKSGSEARRARQIPARSFASRGARYKPFPHGGGWCWEVPPSGVHEDAPSWQEDFVLRSSVEGSCACQRHFDPLVGEVNVGILEVSAESALSFIRRRRDRGIVFRRFRQCDVLVIDEVS